jgi:hypothetical protein
MSDNNKFYYLEFTNSVDSCSAVDKDEKENINTDALLILTISKKA